MGALIAVNTHPAECSVPAVLSYDAPCTSDKGTHPMDLKNLSAKQLDEIVSAAGRRKTELASETVANVRAKIEKILRDGGVTLDEAFPNRSAGARKGSRAKVAPKYRNPKDSTQTWSGRGLKPRWVADALKAGKSLTNLAIAGTSTSVKAKKPGRGPAKKVPAKAPAKAAKGKVAKGTAAKAKAVKSKAAKGKAVKGRAANGKAVKGKVGAKRAARKS